jgi:hypothetical protein
MTNSPSWNEVKERQKERIEEANRVLSMMEEVHIEWPYIKPGSIRHTAIGLLKIYPGWSIEVIKEDMKTSHQTLCNDGAFTDEECCRNHPELFR